MAITNGYITLEQFNAWLDLEDLVDATAAELAVNAACREIDRHCHRRFYADSVVQAVTYKATSDRRLLVDDFLTTTGLIVKTDDGDNGTYGTTWTITTDFVVRPSSTGGIGGLPYDTIEALYTRRFPIYGPRERVQVTAKFGWPAVPDEVVMAALILSARLFRRKSSPEGMAGNPEFGMMRLARNDPDVGHLLDHLIKPTAVFR